jgi:hypothetical protein
MKKNVEFVFSFSIRYDTIRYDTIRYDTIRYDIVNKFGAPTVIVDFEYLLTVL